MSLYKPKKSPFYHYDFWVAGIRFSGSTGRASRQEALKIESARRGEVAKDIEGAKAGGREPMTMGAAATRYWTEVGKHHANDATTLTDLNRLVGYFGQTKPLFEITDDDVAKLVAWRRGQRVRDRPQGQLVAASTVNRSTIEPLQKILNRAAQVWRVPLPHLPRWSRHLLKEPGERVREVQATEEWTLEAIRPDYRPVIAFARASGLRMAECLLRKNQVDLVAGLVRTKGKGGKAIRQPVSLEMRAILMAEMANPTDHVFTYIAQRARSCDRGERLPITISGLKTVWRRAREQGLPADLRFHDMRHDFATKLLRETRNLKLVQKALHHAKIETTTRYAHVLEEEVLAGMEAMSRSRKRDRR